ncbi:methyl-accepting chemotaxis protein [Rhodoferax sp.]|uniref:methyl-accepting chemotaxis protein n=1 Tax=Rhodoferax sp. TaxID=50421 RepID=UPI00374D9CA6
MIFQTLFSPGLWLMRRLRLGAKLLLLAVVLLATPVLVLLQYALSGGGSAALAWFSGICVLLAVYGLLAFFSSFSQDLEQVRGAMGQLVRGDLRLKLAQRGTDELADLAAATSQIGATVSGMVANVRSNAAFVAHAGKSLAHGNRALSDRTEQQAANLEQTAASVEQLSSTVQGTAQTAGEANTQASSVRDAANQGASSMAEAIASVEAIQSSAQRMDEIVGVIDGLAFQTNILALNAAVEAARAGESGRGFAVVASEVRSLAQRSAEAAKEIRQLIGASSSQVASSVQKIRTAGSNMTSIVSGIRDVASNMAQISSSSAEQSTGLSEITSAVRQLDEITQQNAQMVEHAVEQASTLESRASTLVGAVALFKLQQGSAEEAMALVHKAIAQRRRGSSLDSFLRDLTNPAQGFHDRDMYVFVLDRNGRYVAFGGNPAKVGTRVQDIAGINGAGLLQAIYTQAEREPGWVEYDITNPTTGRVQTKMSFVQLVDDLAVGCGVYKNLVVS